MSVMYCRTNRFPTCPVSAPEIAEYPSLVKKKEIVQLQRWTH